MLLLWGLLLALSRAHAASPTTVEIAPGIHMPLLNFGVSNRSQFVEVGGRGLDTAWDYGDLDQLEAGEAVRGSGLKRSELFITTKIPCCPTSFMSCNETMMQTHVDEYIRHDFDMLKLDYVDLLLMHWPCDDMEQTLRVYRHMEAAHKSGKVRAIGVSNFNASVLEALVAGTTVKPAVNQVSFSVGNHDPQRIARWGSDDITFGKAKALGVTTSAWSPLGGVSKVDVLHDPTVESVAAGRNRSTAQIALRWLVQQGIPAVTASNSKEHAISDLHVFDFELSAAEMSRLSAVQPEFFIYA